MGRRAAHPRRDYRNHGQGDLDRELALCQVRCRLLAGPAAERVLGALDARVVDQGANLAVIEVRSSGELLFRELVNGTWLASPVQVYLDLMRGEGRSREMATHLRHERLGF